MKQTNIVSKITKTDILVIFLVEALLFVLAILLNSGSVMGVGSVVLGVILGNVLHKRK